MKNKLAIILACGWIISGCASQRKPCQVERICFAYRAAMLAAIDSKQIEAETKDQARARVCMMTDILKTIAELEEETGHYQ